MLIALSCSETPNEIRLTTQGEVSIDEQLWHHLGKNLPYQKEGYKIYHRDKYVGDLIVSEDLYDLRQNEGEYEWRSLSIDEPIVKETLICFNALIMGNGDGNCVD